MAAGNLNFVDLQDRVNSSFLNTTADSLLSTSAKAWLNDALSAICSDIDGIEDSASQVTVAGLRFYNLHPDLISVRAVTWDGSYLQPRSFEDTGDFYSTGNTYCDRFCILERNPAVIMLGPLPPNAAATLTVYFFREPNPLVQDADIPEIPNRFRPCLADYASSMAYSALGDLGAANAAMARFMGGKERFEAWINGNKTTKPSVVRNLTEAW